MNLKGNWTEWFHNIHFKDGTHELKVQELNAQNFSQNCDEVRSGFTFCSHVALDRFYPGYNLCQISEVSCWACAGLKQKFYFLLFKALIIMMYT